MTLHFDDIELNPEKFELRRAGELVDLEPQVFTLLVLLVENGDRLVTKNEIVATVWGGDAVSDASIANRVKLARHAIGDDGRSQRYIRTVHGRGFRFIGEVETAAEARPPAPAARPLPPAQAEGPETAAPPPQPDAKPSIAVLPFQFIGPDTEFAAAADAIPHELIQALSRLRWLLVIARGSTFQFRAADLDIREVGRVLNVRYCLMGSVVVSGNKVTVTVELSDTANRAVVWGERFSEALGDIHSIREAIVSQVVSSLEVHIPSNEASAARLQAPESLSAWANYHLGLQYMYRFTKDGNAKATALFERAVALDPCFARAHAGLSFTHFQDAFVKYGDISGDPISLARSHAERSLELDPFDPFGNLNLGRSHWLLGNMQGSIDWLDRALALSPNYAQGFYSRGFADMICGATSNSRDFVDNGMILSPIDPLRYGMLGTRALSYLTDGNYEDAALWAEKAARAPGAHHLIAMVAAAAHSLNGDKAKASAWAADTRRRRADANAEDFFVSFPFTDDALRNRIAKAFKASGL